MYSVHAIKFILFVKIKQNKDIVIVYRVIMSSKCELQKMPKNYKSKTKNTYFELFTFMGRCHLYIKKN